MSEFETKSPESSEIVQLREQCASLAQQTTLLFAGLVIVSFTLTAFLGLQARRAGKELDMMKPQAAQMREQSKQEAPFIQATLSRLVEYGKSHADFQPVLAKYGIRPTNAAAPAIPAPAPAPVKK